MNSSVRFAPTLVAVLVPCVAATAVAQTTERVSIATSGTQGNADTGPGRVSVSQDGRFVAFESAAATLVAGDTNGFDDIFVRDRQSGTMERVSIANGGAEANNWSHNASLSGDGRYVAFTSRASNLVAGDTNGYEDVFVRDRQSGTTERVSVDSTGAQATLHSDFPVFSADGRCVAFESQAPLVAGDTNFARDIYVHDLQTGLTERISVDSLGGQTDWSNSPSLSADGRCVAFMSFAANLVPGDTNGARDIFVRDRQSGTTERVSLDSAGSQSNGSSDEPAISGDGRFVAFYSAASNLVGGDTNGSTDVFVRDRLNGTIERVSVDSQEGQSLYGGRTPSLSGDGRFVAFGGDAHLLPGGGASYENVFLRDRQWGTTERVSVADSGAPPNFHCSFPSLSADGSTIAFVSSASNLVSGDTNGKNDVFVRVRAPLSPPPAYCASGTSSNGCSASIAASSSPSVTLASLCNIAITNVDGQKSGLLFYGVDNSGFAATPWAPGSTSSLCVKAPHQRTPVQDSGGTPNACDGSYALDWDFYQATHPTALGSPWSVGRKVYVQAWFRDPLAVKATNLSDALEMTYQP